MRSALLLAATVGLLYIAGRIIERVLTSMAARATTTWDDIVLPLAGRAIRRTLPLLGLILGAPALAVSPAMADVVQNGSANVYSGRCAASCSGWSASWTSHPKSCRTWSRCCPTRTS